jgi:hypothetical protein
MYKSTPLYELLASSPTPLLVRAPAPYFPFTNRQVAKSGIAQYMYCVVP